MGRKMRILCAVVFAVGGLSAAAAVAEGQLRTPLELGILRDGTPLELMVLSEVSSARAKPGDPVRLRLEKPVLLNGVIIMPIGKTAQGVVDATADSKSLLQAGNVSVHLRTIDTAGQKVTIRGDLARRGKGGKNDDTVKAVLAPWYTLLAPGNSGKLKAGEIVAAAIEGDYVVRESDGQLLFTRLSSTVVPPQSGAAGIDGSSSGERPGSSQSGLSGPTSGGSR